MQLVIVDSPLWSIARKTFDKLSNKNRKKWALYIPRFANIAWYEYGINDDDLSWLLRQNISSLVALIEWAETDKYTQVFISWSPVTYLAFSQLKWRKVSEEVRSDYERVMSALAGITEVNLVYPSQWLTLNPRKGLILPSELSTMTHLLSEGYEQYFWRDAIRNIDSQT